MAQQWHEPLRGYGQPVYRRGRQRFVVPKQLWFYRQRLRHCQCHHSNGRRTLAADRIVPEPDPVPASSHQPDQAGHCHPHRAVPPLGSIWRRSKRRRGSTPRAGQYYVLGVSAAASWSVHGGADQPSAHQLHAAAGGAVQHRLHGERSVNLVMADHRLQQGGRSELAPSLHTGTVQPHTLQPVLPCHIQRLQQLLDADIRRRTRQLRARQHVSAPVLTWYWWCLSIVH